MAFCEDDSSSAALFVITNCAWTWNDLKNFWIFARKNRARPPPAAELTNTVTADSRSTLGVSARSITLVLRNSSRTNHVFCFPKHLFSVSFSFGSTGISKHGAGGGNRNHGLGIMRPSLYH